MLRIAPGLNRCKAHNSPSVLSLCTPPPLYYIYSELGFCRRKYVSIRKELTQIIRFLIERMGEGVFQRGKKKSSRDL